MPFRSLPALFPKDLAAAGSDLSLADTNQSGPPQSSRSQADARARGGNWSSQILRLDRQDGDYQQVKRGTVQHEVLEGTKQIQAFEDGETLRIRVTCKRTPPRLGFISYGLAVTLEAKEDIPIYQQVRARIKQPVARIAPKRRRPVIITA